MLPEIVESSGVLGETDALGPTLPITGCAGDQQAATFGQACFEPGSAKNTYGTGCFLLLNTGSEPVGIASDLLATVGWKIADEVTYCLEGAVFVGGAVVQWLRDGLGLFQDSSQIEELVRNTPDSDGVYFVPAFVGLGAPLGSLRPRDDSWADTRNDGRSCGTGSARVDGVSISGRSAGHGKRVRRPSGTPKG